nr:MAG TPA: hypothetical protein [Inoviridae sp.]
MLQIINLNLNGLFFRHSVPLTGNVSPLSSVLLFSTVFVEKEENTLQGSIKEECIKEGLSSLYC